MSFWHRLRSLLTGSPDVVSPVVGHPSLPAAPEDPPLELLLRYSRQIGHLTARPSSVDPAVLKALQTLISLQRQDTAIRMAQSLSRAIPTDRALALLLAESLLSCRRYAESLEPLVRTLTLTLNDPSQALPVRMMLATAHRELGQLREAREQLAEVVAVDVNFPAAQAQLRALAPSVSASLSDGSVGSALGIVQRAILPTVALQTGGRYALLEELGAGRTGTVYRALDKELGCELAIKVFHPHLRQRNEDDALLRALHEARLLSAARHPGIVALYAVEGDDPEQPKQLPLLAMELCRGGSLRMRLRSGPLSVEAALGRACELCETLTELHAGAVSHGDLKPENLLFRGDGRGRFVLPASEVSLGDLVIADFGLSRLRAEHGSVGVGTPGYLSPERFAGSPPSPAADVFAVGVVLAELFCGESAAVLAPSRTYALSAIELLSSVEPGLGKLGDRAASLRQLLCDMLAADPTVRPSAAQVRQRLAVAL
ncbi:MAG: serine/threonine protein kinase [Myxococcales bacterium]|nr:serine/threonine protein kinase [Myxococcales bacterium]